MSPFCKPARSVWLLVSLPGNQIRSQARQDALYAYPKEKSIRRFMDQVRERTKRTTPLRTEELIAGLNPLLRGWGEYYKRAHIRKLFQRLDGWIRRRIWSHRYRRWRNAGWKAGNGCQRRSSTTSTSLFG
jgi:RNA-directed DNA polymerase